MTDSAQLKIGDERIVTIGPIAHGGHFIAHADGRTLFVRHAITGETVRVRITDVNSKMVRADAFEVLEPSPERVPAPCTWAHADGCGGCDFQHIALDAQRRMKQEVLTDALRRFGRLSEDDLSALDLTVRELPGHPEGLHWRSRVTWAQDFNGNVGLRRHHSHDVVPVERCLIAADGVDVPGVAPTGKVLHTVRERTWRMERDGFWQVHEALPEALVAAVLELGRPAQGQVWWDLYAGAGLFAAFLAEAVGPEGHIAAAESAESAIKSARRALHDLPQVALHHSDVTRWLREIDHDAPDGIVLDPPRSGVGAEVVAMVTAAEVPTLVYVACDPVALARDTASFVAAGYRLSGIRAFDAFPMTHHLETVAMFRPSGS